MKARLEDLATLVRNPDALLARLLHEVRTLSQTPDLVNLQKRGVIQKQGAWYRVPNVHDLPEHVAKRIQEMSWDGGILIKFDTSSYEELAELVERMARERGLDQLLDKDVRALSSTIQ